MRKKLNGSRLMKPAILVSSLLAASMAPAKAEELRCSFQSRYVCSPRGCTPIDPSGVFIMLRIDAGRYGRCDGAKPCDWYPLTVSPSGGFLNLDFSSGVQGAKMSQDGSLFIETATLLETLFV